MLSLSKHDLIIPYPVTLRQAQGDKFPPAPFKKGMLIMPRNC